MKTSESIYLILVIALAVVIGGAVLLYIDRFTATESEQALGSLQLCTVTESLVTVGHQEAKVVLSAGAFTWAIIQQPQNASNTLSLSLNATSTAGRGYELTPATSTSPVPELRLGFATDLPFQGKVTGRTNNGSTTVKTTVCK